MSTIRIILDGAQTVTSERAPNPGSMPGYAKDGSDQQIADVVTYIRNALAQCLGAMPWGNAAPAVSAGQVARARR